MADIKLLQDELEQTITRRKELRDKHKGATLPEEVAKEDTQLHERGLKLRQIIEQEKVQVRDKDFNDLASYLDDPVHFIPRSINADDDGKKSLRELGWDVQDGMICRETSIGVKQVMFGEDVLFGPIPEHPRDAQVASYFKQTRAIMQPVYRSAYIKYLRAVRMESGQAMLSLSGEEQKALSEGSDGAGGNLVPVDMQAEMLARTAQQSIFRQRARTVNTSRDKVVYPRVLPAAATESGMASGADSVFSSGFVGGWAGETPAFSEKDPGFGTFEIPIKKLRVATKLSNDFISDAVISIAAWLAQNGAENMALVEDQGFLLGDGSALQPLGLLNDPGLVTVDVEGTTSNTISNSSSATTGSDKLIQQVYALPSQYAGNASWIMRRSIEGVIRTLADLQGRYMWPLQSGSMFGPPNGAGNRQLMEYPIANSDFMPTHGVNGAKVTVFGDLSTYIIAQRAAISTQILRERFADNDQTGIIIWERLGGALWNPDALRVGIV